MIDIMKKAIDGLTWIAQVSACDYEYQRHARKVLEEIQQMYNEKQAVVKEIMAVHDVIIEIINRIQDAKILGKTHIKFYGADFGNVRLYSNPPTAFQQEIVDSLRRLGYIAEIKIHARQFVDIWLDISWTN
jgi:hypothetical protein